MLAEMQSAARRPPLFHVERLGTLAESLFGPLMRLAWIVVALITSAGYGQAGSSAQASAAAKAPDNQLCLSCHVDIGDKIKGHAHANVGCATCHTKHEEYPHPEGLAKPACATCHANIARDYSHSVHAQAAGKGNGSAPDCSTCHGTAHELEAASTLKFRTAVPELCGACHA